MDFQRGRYKEDVEINLIPMIDVLLVILIFLMTTTTFSKLRELEVTLPVASAEQPAEQKKENINVVVNEKGQYLVNGAPVEFTDVDALSAELKKAAGGNDNPVVVIAADAKSTHQSVVSIMDAAARAGFVRITFATQEKR